MKFKTALKLSAIAQSTGARLLGDPDFMVTGLNEIHMVEPGDITFVDHPKYYAKVLASAASVIIIDKEPSDTMGKNLLILDHPFEAYNNLAKTHSPFVSLNRNISESAVIGLNTVIQPGVVIGHNVRIGKDCILHPNVVIYDNCVIGDRVQIHAGAILGSDAFYFKKQLDAYTTMHSCGRVVIGDDVTIGAACTIDRGVSGDTTIGDGSKLDNQVHVGHDTVIGKHCLFAAQVGIAGVVKIEDHVILWGQVGVQKDLTIGKGAVVLGQSGIGKSLDAGKTYFGSPTRDAIDKMRELALLKRLPEVFERLDKSEY